MFGAPQHNKAVNYTSSATGVLTLRRTFLVSNGESNHSDAKAAARLCYRFSKHYAP